MKYLFLLIFLPVTTWAQTILFIGDSLTEGYQLEKDEAYPALVEKELKKKHPGIKVINGGVSGATSASGPKRLNWYVKARPNILVLALGANDGLRGLDLKETEKNLSAVVETAKTQKMKVLLAGMMIPTNYGEKYRKDFSEMFTRLAKKYDIKTIPFLLEGVAMNPKLNLPDGIHPNTKGHEIMAKTVVKYLEPLL